MNDPVLPYNSFRYFAMQGTRMEPGVTAVTGTTFVFGPYATRDNVEEICLNQAAHLAVEAGLPWNPFQVSLIFRPA